MKSKLLYGLIAVGILTVFYLSWVPNPRIGEVVYMPNWLAKWTDAQENDTIRTGVPFLGMGILLGFYLKNKSASLKWWCLSALLLILVAVLSELGQLFMPFRSCDIRDVIWASIGTAIGLFFGYLLGRWIPSNSTQ